MTNMTPSESVKAKEMIQPHELMIGNYVRASLTNEIIEVDWLVIKHVSDGNIQAAGYDNSSVYEPIPLTEQWLREFGFHVSDQFVAWGVKSNIKHVDMTESVYLVLNDDEWRVAICEHSSAQPAIDDDIPAIRYVHQVQNLHWCLTSKLLMRNSNSHTS